MAAAEGVSVPGTASAFCAATVCATDVCMIICESSVGVPAPQEVMSRVVIIEMLKSKYFMDQVIFFLSYTEIIILLNENARKTGRSCIDGCKKYFMGR